MISFQFDSFPVVGLTFSSRQILFFYLLILIIDKICTVCWWKLRKSLAEFRLASERVGMLVATLMIFLHGVNTFGGWTLGPLAPVWPRSASFSRLGVNHEYYPEMWVMSPSASSSLMGWLRGTFVWERYRYCYIDRLDFFLNVSCFQ